MPNKIQYYINYILLAYTHILTRCAHLDAATARRVPAGRVPVGRIMRINDQRNTPSHFVVRLPVMGHSISIQQIFGCFSTDPLGLF